MPHLARPSRSPSILLVVAVLAAVAAVAPVPLGAEEPVLLHDINTDGGGGYQNPPSAYASLDDSVVFVAGDSVNGLEPWTSDGTPGGTHLLVDTQAGITGVEAKVIGKIGSVALLALHASSADRDRVWRTDGTTTGTYPVSDVAAFQGLGNLPGPGVVLYGGGTGLWRSDGTVAGTRLVRGGLFGIEAGDVVGGLVFFAAHRTDGGLDLWRSDGTEAGTLLLRTLRTLQTPSSPIRRLGGEVLFFSEDAATGEELWASDGTVAGTRLVKDLTPGPESTYRPFAFYPGDHLSYFITGESFTPRPLWRTDGTTAGTVLLHTFGQNEASPPIWVAGDRAVLVASDAAHGRELWVSDGTAPGTHLLVDLCVGTCSADPRFLGEAGGRLILEADDGTSGREMWATDGTALGTRRLGDLCPGDCSVELTNGLEALGLVFVRNDSYPGGLWRTDGTVAGTLGLGAVEGVFGQLTGAPAGGALIFTGGDFDWEVWRSSGTSAGTSPVTVIDGHHPGSSYPQALSELHGKVYFLAYDAGECRPWVTDGTPAGTHLLADLGDSNCSTYPADLARTGERVVFFARSFESDAEVWSSDGTAAGTHKVFDLPRILYDSLPKTTFGGKLFFFTYPSGLWRTDGTTAGTIELAGFGGAQFVPWRGKLYMVIGDFDENSLWRTDGTVAGTTEVLDLPPNVGGFGPSGRLAVVGDLLYFLSYSSAPELWRTDGTQAGTVRVKLLPPLEGGPSPGALTAFAGRLFFVSYDASHGQELWVSDGTAAGTHLLVDVAPGARDAAPRDLVVFGGRLWFVADDGVHGEELWSTDGTAAGTRMLADLWPGSAGSAARSLTPTSDRLLFTASDGLHGFELWQTDGTAGATRRLTDIVPGPGSSVPMEPTVAGDRVVFSAAEAETGREPWALRLAAIPPPGPGGAPAAPDGLVAEAISTTAVRLTWRDNSSDEESFAVEASWPESGFVPVATAPAGTPFAVVGGLAAGTPYTFRVRALNSHGASGWSGEASATPFRTDAGPCVASAEALCLLGGRFEIRAQWHDQHNGGHGLGKAVPFPGSGRTGLFWFFNPANIELVVKNLDGSTVNGFIWTFYGALSDVEYWITVTDTEEGRNRTYHNVPGTICGEGDTASFPEAVPAAAASPAANESPFAAAGSPVPPEPVPAAGTGSGACTPGPQTLCLQNGRFAVEVDWHDQHNGGDGVGTAIPSTNLSGYFWFFNPTNVELVVKILDATTVNGHFWVFYGALSDVEYTIRVTDTSTGDQRTYPNAPGNICGRADTDAF